MFSETWPASGMTRNGRAYQQRPLVPRTFAGACGLLPTPVASEGFNRRKADQAKRRGDGLETIARWPTPKASAANYGRPRENDRGDLQAAVMFRTPNARDWKGMSAKSWRERASGDKTPTLPDQIGGQLNPTWVEWLMGYPLEWTACAASATPSSRRLRSGSRNASTKPKRRA
jgi:hypothetical protein